MQGCADLKFRSSSSGWMGRDTPPPYILQLSIHLVTAVVACLTSRLLEA